MTSKPRDSYYQVKFRISIYEYGLPAEVSLSFGEFAPNRDVAIARASRTAKLLISEGTVTSVTAETDATELLK